MVSFSHVVIIYICIAYSCFKKNPHQTNLSNIESKLDTVLSISGYCRKMAGTFCFIQTFSLNYYLLYYFSHHPWWFLDTALMVIKSIKQLHIIIISLTCILFSLKVKFNFHPIIWNSGIWLMVNSSDRGERVKIYTVDDICTYFHSAQRIQNEV